jgi:hypothetical protein
MCSVSTRIVIFSILKVGAMITRVFIKFILILKLTCSWKLQYILAFQSISNQTYCFVFPWCHGLDDLGSITGSSNEGFPFLFAIASWPALGPMQPPIQMVPEGSPRVRRPEHENDHSPSFSAEIMNAWSYTSTPPHVFMAWYLIKHRDNFTCVSYFHGNIRPVFFL